MHAHRKFGFGWLGGGWVVIIAYLIAFSLASAARHSPILYAWGAWRHVCCHSCPIGPVSAHWSTTHRFAQIFRLHRPFLNPHRAVCFQPLRNTE